MNFTPVKTPLAVKKMFPSYIWDITGSDNIIYLTFDDGPTPEVTQWTLDILNQYNAKATFFCIGNNVKKHPEIFQQIINENHAVGNHTFNHKKGWKTKTSAYIDDVIKASQYINSNLFRPPYGKIKPKQAKKLIQQDYHIIMWDVISIDWSNSITKEKCYENVIENTNSGSIVVFHDSKKAFKNMKYTLPKVLKHFSKLGYKFNSIKF